MIPLDELLPAIEARAAACDESASFPGDDVAALASAGLLTAPLPASLDGEGMGTAPHGAEAIFTTLRRLGRANLSVARLFEAHVNVIRLVVRFGTERQLQHVAALCRAGELFGLWVTDAPGQVVRLVDGRLQGVKGPGSATGHLRHALITVHEGDAVRMALLEVEGTEAVTPLAHRMHGMRASANGSITLDGIALDRDALLGEDGDYLREPDFSTGAWRTMAATLGGMDALLAAVRSHLLARGHAGLPLQQARFGTMLIACETAALWTREAGRRAELGKDPSADLVAYVNLARIAVETACLDLMRDATRAVGLAAMVRPHPIERLLRDLATFLRQPAPDLVLTEAGLHGLHA